MRAPQQEVVLTQAEIQAGQETYLARGQHIGSIWDTEAICTRLDS